VAGVTIPMGILQSTSTQTDYVLAFWLVCFAYFGLLFKARPTLSCSLVVGLSLGLAILTKPTAYYYALPFVIWYGLAAISRLRWRVWQPALIVLAAILMLNLPFYSRNQRLYHSFLGPFFTSIQYNIPLLNKLIQVEDNSGSAAPPPAPPATDKAPAAVEYLPSTRGQRFASNILKNISLHLGTPFPLINHYSGGVIVLLHDFIGIDVNASRPVHIFSIYTMSLHEDFAGNLAHFGLLCFIIAGSVLKLSSGTWEWLKHLAALLVGFLIFVFWVGWSPWNSRLHLALFVLSAPIIGLALSRLRYDKLANATIVALLLLSTPWVIRNASRPLVGPNNVFSRSRAEQYFANRPDMKDYHKFFARSFTEHQCPIAGLILGADSWEYPVWVLTHAQDPSIRFYHLAVENPSATLQAMENWPDKIDCICSDKTSRCDSADGSVAFREQEP
ncbi:MAG: hypothetical protein ACE5H9_13450, partial [Anaerolineae bacterium]